MIGERDRLDMAFRRPSCGARASTTRHLRLVTTFMRGVIGGLRRHLHDQRFDVGIGIPLLLEVARPA